MPGITEEVTLFAIMSKASLHITMDGHQTTLYRNTSLPSLYLKGEGGQGPVGANYSKTSALYNIRIRGA